MTLDPKYKTRLRFHEDSGVANVTIGKVEKCANGEIAYAPDLETVERWLGVFGVKLSAFFAQFEQQKSGHPQRITPGFEEWERALDDILKSRNSDDVTTLRIILERMSGRALGDRAAPRRANQ